MCGRSVGGSCGRMCGYAGVERPALIPVDRQAFARGNSGNRSSSQPDATGQTAGLVVLILISSADRVRFVMGPRANPTRIPYGRSARPISTPAVPARAESPGRRRGPPRAEAPGYAPNPYAAPQPTPFRPRSGALVVYQQPPARPHLLASSGYCLLRVRCPGQSDKRKASAAPRPCFDNRPASQIARPKLTPAAARPQGKTGTSNASGSAWPMPAQSLQAEGIGHAVEASR
jgi:hypothetical protein